MTKSRLELVLSKNKYVSSPKLPFKISIDANIDRDYCDGLVEDFREVSSGWHSLDVTPNMSIQIPDKPGLYMFIWRSCLSLRMKEGDSKNLEWCIYVGKAGKSLRARFDGEYGRHISGDPSQLWNKNLSSREEKIRTYMTLRPLTYLYAEVSDASAIDMLESKLIDILSPPLNSISTIRASFAKSEPAF